ncbi:MAG: PAS domain-containing sensor histidine kinase [Ignavibacteria bacterium]|nr:PAS domain-containing sensor histidine kinase [Ignavibacteria bacterium]
MEDLYKKLIMNSPVGYAYHRVILDENQNPIDYIFLEVNKSFEELTGLPSNTVINRTVREVIPDIVNDSFNWIAHYGQLALKGGESNFIQKSQSLNRWYRVFAFSTEPLHFATLFVDVTDEYTRIKQLQEKEETIERLYESAKKLNEDLALSQSTLEEILFEKNKLLYDISIMKEKLEELNSEKDKLFSIIAHDLRSPFSGILGVINLLATNTMSLSYEEIAELVKLLKESSESLYKLIENLLEWSRVQRGLIELTPDYFNLQKLVTENIEIQKIKIEQKELNFEVNIPEHIIVFADLNTTNTILRNLISNAIKFTPRGGRIEIKAQRDEESVLVSIKDTGIGIPKEMLSDLFKVGAKTFRPGTEGEKSTGLGLLLCKEYIERNKGKIWVESEVGVGSTFYFTLPISEKT